MARGRGSLILGINSAYHESAAALVRDGELLFAVEEERFTRVKHAKTARVTNPDELPWNAILACLEFAGGASLSDLDAIAYSLEPNRRLALIGTDPYEIDDPLDFGTRQGEEEFNRRVLEVPATLSRAAGDDSLGRRFHFVPHHRAHAASAFYSSPFRQAAVLVVDGIGENATAWLGRGSADGLEQVDEVLYPHSIGMLWERVAVYLGFSEFDACKVMGLAAYGDPQAFAVQFDRLFRVVGIDQASGQQTGPPIWIDPVLARLRARDVRGLELLFGPRRKPDEPAELPRFAEVAAGLQQRTEEAVLACAERLALATGERNVVYAGGVALNCVANARLEREGPFRSLFIIGAAHDAGTAIGAALDVAHQQNGAMRKSSGATRVGFTPFLGPSYEETVIDAAIVRGGFQATRIEEAATVAASLIADGQIVGWFQGRMEFGPRALGARSLLADPRRAKIRDVLNRRIKHRESFRPFGASILAEDVADWFNMPTDRPGAASCRDLMILAYPVLSERVALIPAVVHQDGTCRVQVVDRQRDPLFHTLITKFRDLSGVPVILNTSFNDQEPLVASPDDALKTFAATGIDALFLGDRLVQRAR